MLLAIGKLGQLDFDFWMGSKFSVSGAACIQGRLRVRDQQTDPEEPRGGRRSPRQSKTPRTRPARRCGLGMGW